MQQYNPLKIEQKWQKTWAETGLYKTPAKPKQPYYLLTMFPYPSGDLHAGHWYAFSAPDTLARYRRMLGHDVLFPMGWDAFGLPAENAAIKRNIPPAKWTRSNIASMKQQVQRFGGMFDWERELSTADPEYYRWTQRLFLLLYEKNLAYRKGGLQNWCPSCQTVLANEQVVGDDNVCERCATPVVKKELEQWFFKITDYAERLLADLGNLDWPERIVTMQRNWIGKSQGARVHFAVDGHEGEIEVFTTRPDTLFGATYMVLAPEHPLVNKITAKAQAAAVKKYQARTQRRTNLDRLEGEKNKTGIFTGAYAINPVNQEKLPIWISDYVLMEYGSGAIMAVPAHDERDYAFAKKFDLPVKTVIEPVTGTPQKEPEFRRSIVAVVENAKGELLSINWGEEHGGYLFVGGGLEEGEAIEACARREVAEETGYHELELVDQTEIVHHHYLARSKNIPRQIEAVGLHFRLKSDKKRPQQLEAYEKGKFKVEWISKDKAQEAVGDPLHRYVFERLLLGQVYTGEGIAVNSGKYDGMESSAMREAIVKDLQKSGQANAVTNYKLRDWLISRQRYWGAPIPIVYCKECGIVPVPESDLPILLPEEVEFEPTGQSPLKQRRDFVETKCPECKGPAERETDTIDTFVDSSWYFLRYPNTGYTKGMFDPAAVKTWLPVDHYTGGIEHAILHLLYARFITKVLADHAGLGFEEPFMKLSSQGTMLGPDGYKMSKSRGNVVNPDEVVNSGYGADSFRTYQLFIGPWTEGGPFNTEGLSGVYRFLNRVWNLVYEFQEEPGGSPAKADNQSELETSLAQAANRTIKKVTQDLEAMSFNTAIAAMMELVNSMYKLRAELPFAASRPIWQQNLELLLLVLAPFAPHITEELWQTLGHKQSIHTQRWPAWQEDLLVQDIVNVAVQVNGKLRAAVAMPKDASEQEMADFAREHEKVQKYLKGKQVARTIAVQGRLVNFVTK